jgi:hypothetical protein
MEIVRDSGKGIQSLRLRLHSGLRQQGSAFGPALVMRPKAEALGYLEAIEEQILRGSDRTKGQGKNGRKRVRSLRSE